MFSFFRSNNAGNASGSSTASGSSSSSGASTSASTSGASTSASTASGSSGSNTANTVTTASTSIIANTTSTTSTTSATDTTSTTATTSTTDTTSTTATTNVTDTTSTTGTTSVTDTTSTTGTTNISIVSIEEPNMDIEKKQWYDKIKEKWSSYDNLPAHLKLDRDLAKFAIEIQPMAIQYMKNTFANDLEIAELLVGKSGYLIQYLPMPMRSNETIALKALTNEPYVFNYLPDDMKNSSTFVEKALRQNIKVKDFVSTGKLDVNKIIFESVTLETDPKKIMETLRQNIKAIQYVNHDILSKTVIDPDVRDQIVKYYNCSFTEMPAPLSRNKNIALKVVAQDPTQFPDIDASLTSDLAFVLKIVQTNYRVFQFLPNEIQKYREIALEAIKQDATLVQYITDMLKNDIEFALTVVQTNPKVMQFIPTELLKDKKFVLGAIKFDASIVQNVVDVLKNDYQFAETLIQNNDRVILYLPLEFYKDGKFVEIAKQSIIKYFHDIYATHKNHIIVNTTLLENPDLAKEAIKYGCAFCNLPIKTRENQDIILYAIEKNINVFHEIPVQLKTDKTFMMTVLLLRPNLISYMDDALVDSLALTEDQEVKIAEKLDNRLVCLPSSFRKRKRIVMAAVSADVNRLQYADESLQADPDIIEPVLKKFSYQLSKMPIALRSNKAVVMSAVKQNGYELAFASYNLQQDYDVLSAAAKTSIFVLEHAPLLNGKMGLMTGAMFNKICKAQLRKKLPRNMTPYNKGYQYQQGFNRDKIEFDHSGKCCGGGFYATDEANIQKYDDNTYGEVIWSVKIPDTAIMFFEGEFKFKTSELYLDKIVN